MSEFLPFLMLPMAFGLMFLGVQVVFAMLLTATAFGLVTFGPAVMHQFVEKIDDLASNFVFAAIPLFVFMGAVLEKSLRRFGDCDAYFFESETEDERGFTACTLKKDKNFANHLVVLSAHAPSAAFAQSKADLRAAVESLALVDFLGELTDADLTIAKPLGGK